jgi:hypothetical protein
MFTHSFEVTLFSCAAILVFGLGSFAAYCQKKANDFVNTGRITDVNAWTMKSTVSWIASSVLAFGMLS